MIVVDVEGVVQRNGRYLMIVRGPDESHAPGALSFPGGKVELTDEPENVLESALHREIREETGVEVDDEMLYIHSGMFDMDDGRKALAVFFLCRYKSGDPRADSNEVESVRWMTPDKVRRDDRSRPWLKDFTQVVEAARRSRDEARRR